MTTQIVNTKVELLVEAFEGLMLAVKNGNHDLVVMHRKDCADQLREFLKPILRVITPEEVRRAQE